jgi:hypothetical protein
MLLLVLAAIIDVQDAVLSGLLGRDWLARQKGQKGFDNGGGGSRGKRDIFDVRFVVSSNLGKIG